MFASPPTPSRYGYTSKIWLAAQLELIYLGGLYYAWFARELNPIQNGSSSNPLLLYLEIDTAVKKNDVNHAKIKDLRAKLLSVVALVIRPANPRLARTLKRQIVKAPIAMFRPQIWRIDLTLVPSTRWDSTGATIGWDEQLVKDLGTGEFEAIVE